jgi:hypothetical protein
MSDYESDDEPHSHIEWNPCIRKGKHKPKHKKQKKYEAKIQKMNLIRSKNHKVIDSDFSAIVYSEHMLLELLKILKTSDIYNWNADYEYLYEKVYCLDRIDKYKTQYDKLQQVIEQEQYDEYEEEQYEYRRELYECYRWDRYDRW